MSLVKSTATIGSYTLISRVFGFIRDVTIASSLGAGMLSDAFFVAFKLPNFLRRLFAEGAFNSAFVPLFAGMLATEGPEKARQFAGEIFSFLLAVLTVVTIFFIVFMPWMMFILAPGFSGDPVKYDLTVLLTRITFPYIIFISGVSLLGAILNSHNKFAAVAATPIIMNLCLIIAPSIFDFFTPNAAYSLAWGVMMAGIAQYIWLVWFARRIGMMPRLMRPRINDNVKKLLTLIAPAALGAGVAQINLFIDLIIASNVKSGVSYLYYADRINELPLAVIGIAVGTALLPMLSRQIREGKKEEANFSQNRALELTMLLSFPASVALMVIAEPIIIVMFEHGAFGAKETAATFPALMAFAAGLPAFILIKVLTPAFYAHHDTKTPFKIATLCIVVNFVFNLLLLIPFRHVGMAMATSIAGWLNIILLSVTLSKRGIFHPDTELFRRMPRIAAACLIMGIVLWIVQRSLWSLFTETLWLKITALALLVIAGLTTYGLSVLLLRVVDLSILKKHLTRRKTQSFLRAFF